MSIGVKGLRQTGSRSQFHNREKNCLITWLRDVSEDKISVIYIYHLQVGDNLSTDEQEMCWQLRGHHITCDIVEAHCSM